MGDKWETNEHIGIQVRDKLKQTLKKQVRDKWEICGHKCKPCLRQVGQMKGDKSGTSEDLVGDKWETNKNTLGETSEKDCGRKVGDKWTTSQKQINGKH